QPADALNERAGHLPAVDARIDRLADVHQQVAAQDLHHPRKAIDLHLGNRTALCEVEKRSAAAFVDVPIDSLRGVEAFIAETHALVIGLVDELWPWQLASAIDFRETRLDLATRIHRGASVEIRGARGGGG